MDRKYAIERKARLEKADQERVEYNANVLAKIKELDGADMDQEAVQEQAKVTIESGKAMIESGRANHQRAEVGCYCFVCCDPPRANVCVCHRRSAS
jgi:hypothetical protein